MKFEDKKNIRSINMPDDLYEFIKNLVKELPYEVSLSAYIVSILKNYAEKKGYKKDAD